MEQRTEANNTAGDESGSGSENSNPEEEVTPNETPRQESAQVEKPENTPSESDDSRDRADSAGEDQEQEAMQDASPEAADDDDNSTDNVQVEAPKKRLAAPLKAKARGNLYDEVTGDTVRIADVVIDEIVDGTGPFDDNSEAGNDANDHNKVVRSYDTVVYALHYTTEADTLGDLYKHGWIYCEATLPVSPDKATFDLNAIERDYPDGYDGSRDVVYDEATGVQKLVWFRERIETKNGQGEIIEPLPNEATFPVTVNVLAAGNGDEIKPTFTLSVAYQDGDELKTEGTFDKPKSVVADPVKVSAAPKYNVRLNYNSNSEDFNGLVDTWDFSTGNDASEEYPALYKNAGQVYGKMISVGITLQLYNDDPAKGMKGVVIPDGPIEFDLDLGAQFAGNTVDAPLIWSYGPQIGGKSAQQDGREVNAYVATNADYAVYEAPRNEQSTKTWRDSNPNAASPIGDSGTVNCWDGGTWHMKENGSTVHVTVDDYEINMNWFPNADLGNAATNPKIFNPKTGVQNIGAFSGAQLFLIIPFGGEPGTDDFYPNKYNADGNVKLLLSDSGLKATAADGQKVQDAKGETKSQGTEADDNIEANILLTRPGTRVNRVFYQAENRYGAYSERGINDTYATFLDGSDVATLGQTISTCWGLYVNPFGQKSQSVKHMNSLLKFDPEVMTPTGDNTANDNGSNSLYPKPTETKFLYGFKPDGSTWKDIDEMDEATEKDLVFYDSPTGGPGTCVAILAEARDYPESAQQERMSFSAKFTIKDNYDLVGNSYPLTSGSYAWNGAAVTENGGSIPSRAGGNTYSITADPSYESYYSSTQIKENGENVNFRKAWYDEEGYHGENGNYIYGDTIYIVGYTTKVQKNVEQGNGAANPKPVVSYSLSKGQSIVDYVLKPDFNIPDVQGVDFSNMKTTLTVSDTLPEGVTYRTGSAYLGGEWKVSEEFPNRSDKAYLHGSIEGGTAREPDSITYNEDGTTTLTWEFPNTAIETLKEDMWIHFSANLPQAISKTTSYVNTVVVSSTEDKRKQESGNGNLDTATVQVAPASDLVCTKQVDEPLVDTDSPIGFKLRWNNTASAGSFDNVMMDTMPSSGKNGSDFSGSYVVEDPITIKAPAGKSNTNYTFYYTTDTAAYDQQASDYQQDYKDGKFTGDSVTLQGVKWTKADIAAPNADGECEVAAVAGKPVSAFIILGKIDKLEELSAHVVLQPKDNDFGDVFVNMLSSNLSTTTTEARVVDRVISGKVWIDENINGSSAETDEPLVQGVRVELLILNTDTGAYEAVNDKNGNPRFALTDENGYYEFNILKAGTYRVNFTNGGRSLKSFVSTIQNAEGVETAYNSQTTPIYEDNVFGFIEGIELPPASEMNSSPYRVPYQDLGLYYNAVKDYGTEDIAFGDLVKTGDVIPYEISFSSVHTEEQDVTIEDTFSVGLEYQNDISLTAKNESGGSVRVTLVEDSVTKNDDGSVTYRWTLKDVPAKGSCRISYSALVTDDAIEPLFVQNDAKVNFSKSGSYRDIGTLKNPLSEKKYGADTPAGADFAEVKLGDEIKYEIRWINVEDKEQTITIVDPLDKGLDVDEESISEDGKYDASTHSITWTIKAEPDTSGSVEFVAAINKTGEAKGKVVNTATVSLGKRDPVELNKLENPVKPKVSIEDEETPEPKIIPEPTQPEPKDGQAKTGNGPGTGDNGPIAWIALLAIAAIASGVFIYRRKTK